MDFEDIARAVGAGFRVPGFGGSGYESVWEQLKPWFAKISTNGVMKWLPKAAIGMPCQVPEYEQGVPVGPCSYSAVEQCICCRRPTCLHHSFVDAQGDMICYLCVVAMRAARNPEAQRQEPPREEPPKRPDPVVDARAKAWWARGVLGVQEGVAWADVKTQYKKLSAQYHPDRKGGDETRFKDVQKAFELLKTIYGEN